MQLSEDSLLSSPLAPFRRDHLENQSPGCAQDLSRWCSVLVKRKEVLCLRELTSGNTQTEHLKKIYKGCKQACETAEDHGG